MFAVVFYVYVDLVDSFDVWGKFLEVIESLLVMLFGLRNYFDLSGLETAEEGEWVEGGIGLEVGGADAFFEQFD